MSRLAPTLLTLLVAAAPAAALAHDRGHEPAYGYGANYYMGRVEVYNGSGTRVTLSFPGQPAQVVEAYRTAVFFAPAGEGMLRATYRQFGADRTLQTDRLMVYAGRSIRVSLAPEHLARVLVTNKSPFNGTLLVNGVGKALLTPGEVRVVTLQLGSADLQMLSEGRVVGQTHLELRPFAEPTWCVEVPAVGDLLVQNPLPIPVQLVAGVGAPVTLAPYGQTTLSRMPAGSLRVVARRVSGQVIDDERVEIRTFGLTTWRVDAPRTGLVTLDSDMHEPSEVRLDGRLVSSLRPDGIQVLEASLGWHQVEARDVYGRVVYADWVEVEPFNVAKIEFGDRLPGRPVGDRDDYREGDRDRGYDHDGDRDEHRDDDRNRRDHDEDSVAQSDEHCNMR